MSVAGREIFDWLPVFVLTTEDVFRIIAGAGRSPYPVYSFCNFASRSNLYKKYAQLKRRIAHTLSPTRTYLPELTGIPVEIAVRTLLRTRDTRGPGRDPWPRQFRGSGAPYRAVSQTARLSGWRRIQSR